MREKCVMHAVNTDAQSTTDSRMMVSVKQIAPRRNVTGPAHHLGLWDGMTRPLRVGVIGANPNRARPRIPTSRRCAASRMCSWRRWRPPAVPALRPPRRRSASARPTTIPAP